MKIHDFARLGDIEGVYRELAAGVSIESREIVSNDTPLRCACAMPDASQEMIRFLVEQGAQIIREVFAAAVQCGSVETIRFMLESGAKVDERNREEECGTLAMAAYGRSSSGDTSLIPVFSQLIEHGADVNIVSSYRESALSVTSHRGRFDAVAFLLDHSADPQELEWTDLMRAVAMGTVEEVRSLLAQGASLVDRDSWERTPWLLSLQGGDLEKAKLLLSAGADRNDCGRCGQTPLMYAVEGNHISLLKWLLAEGFDVNAADELEQTPLLTAIEHGYRECVAILLEAGADANKGPSYNRPIEAARDIEIVRLLVAAGEDFNGISDEMRRHLTGMQDRDPPATPEQYRAGKHREFGHSNPQRMDNAFWRAMVLSGCNAYRARRIFGDTQNFDRPAVWSYERFGRTTTLLPDGRIIEVAGEHEDAYDADFCIYNDVVVFDGKGGFEIYGYLESLFPPTDFHSATQVGDYIYLIGSLGYGGQRKAGETPVFRLHCKTFRMERLRPKGDGPGWIHEHRAWYEKATSQIYISEGKILLPASGQRTFVENTARYALSLKNHRWVRLNP